MGSLHLKRECGASLNAGELTRKKKVNMGENLQPKHCPNRFTFTNEIHVCRFERGLNLAVLKSPVHRNSEFGASLNARKHTKEKKKG